jgi:phospholipid transport system substrate-binding protein
MTARKIQIAVAGALLAFLAMAALSPDIGSAREAGPAEQVEHFNDALVESMKSEEDMQGRKEIVSEAFTDVFAWKYMARVSAGGTYSDFSDEEKRRYLEAYLDWSVSTWADRFSTFKGQKFEVSMAEEPAEGNATVVSTIHKSDGGTVDLHYKMRQGKEGEWLVVDIQVRGVSQLATTRAQFVSVLLDEGLDSLIGKLEEKTMGLVGDVSG